MGASADWERVLDTSGAAAEPRDGRSIGLASSARSETGAYGVDVDEQTRQSYEVAGFGQGEPNFGDRAAVLVVDMCNAYFTQGSPLDLDQPAVIEATRELIARARAADVAVVWTRVEYEPGGENNLWYQRLSVLSVFDRGSELGDWVPGLEPADSDVVVTKQHASGFFGTDLADQLARLNVDHLLIAGVSTSGCVRATATDASAHGFAPLLVAEAVGDRTPQVHDANLFDLAAKYADVITLSQATEHFENINS